MFKLYTRDGCQFCEASKLILKWGGHDFQEIKIGTDVTREQVIEMFPERKTLPIVTKGDMVIGGHEDLTNYLANLR